MTNQDVHEETVGGTGTLSAPVRDSQPTHRGRTLPVSAGEREASSHGSESSDGCLRSLLGKRERETGVGNSSENPQTDFPNDTMATPLPKRKSTCQTIVDDFDKLFKSPEIVFEFDKSEEPLDPPCSTPQPVSHRSSSEPSLPRRVVTPPLPPVDGPGLGVEMCDPLVCQLGAKEEEEADVKRAVEESLKTQVSEASLIVNRGRLNSTTVHITELISETGVSTNSTSYWLTPETLGVCMSVEDVCVVCYLCFLHTSTDE